MSQIASHRRYPYSECCATAFMGHHTVPVQRQLIGIRGITIVPASRQQHTVLSSRGAHLCPLLPVASVPRPSGSVASSKTLNSTADDQGPPGSASWVLDNAADYPADGGPVELFPAAGRNSWTESESGSHFPRFPHTPTAT